MTTSNSAKLAAFVCTVALLLGCFYANCLQNQASFFIVDIYAGWQPFLTYIGDRMRDGQFPLWNPYCLNGISELAVMAPTIFYPLNTLFAVLPFNSAYAMLLITQQLVAGSGMFLLVRSFGWGNFAAGLGGFAMALSGLMFALQPTPTLQGTICWLLVSWWALRTIDRPKRDLQFLGTGLLCVCVFLLVTAGVAEVFAPGLVLLGSVSIADFLMQRRQQPKHAACLLGLRMSALGIGIIMSTCALLPANEWMHLSRRAHGMPLSEVFSLSANWYDILCLGLLQPLGDMYQPLNPFRSIISSLPTYTPYIADAFVGPVIITLALWGWFDTTWRWRFWVIALLIASVTLCMAADVPALWKLAEALNLRMFRYPIKAMAFVTILLVLSASRGMHVFVSGQRSSGNTIAFVGWIGVLAAAAGLLVACTAPQPFPHLTWSPPILAAFGQSALISASLGIVCALLFHQRPAAPDRSAWILLAACVALLLVNAWRFNKHEGPADFYTRPSLVADKISELVPKEGSLRRCVVTYQTPAVPLPALAGGPPLIRVYEVTRQLMGPYTNIPLNIDVVASEDLAQTADYWTLWQTAYDRRSRGNNLPIAQMCRMSSVPLMVGDLGRLNEARVVGERYPLPDPHLFLPAYSNDQLNLSILKVQDPLPRVYFAPQVKWGTPHAAVVDFIANSDRSLFDARTLTILEKPEAQAATPKIWTVPPKAPPATATFLLDTPEQIKIAATTPIANFLVLNDQFYPGWQATVDEKPTTIYAANVLYRAVFVPAGQHTVEFNFAPPTLSQGLILHALGWLAILAFFVAALFIRCRSTYLETP